ncbi:unnamed protein product, partial [marine sediment metagenome]
MSFTDLFHPDDVDAIYQSIEKALAERQPFHLTYRIKHRRGDWRWIEEKGVGLFHENRETLLEGHVSDVTEKMEAEQKLYQSREELQRNLNVSEATLQSIINNTTAVIYMKDAAGRYVLANPRFHEAMKTNVVQVIGKTDLDLFPEEIALKLQENDRHVLASGQPFEFEEVIPQDDGPHTYLSIKFRLEETPGEPFAVCGISTDITDRKASEKAVLAERQLLRELHRIQERERKLLAYEIHDGFIQDVVGAKMMV